MFETSVVRVQAKTTDRRLLLTVSIAAHAAAIVAVVAASVATVSLPRHAPNQFSVPVFQLPVVIPPKQGDGHPKAAAAAAPQQQKRPAAPPAGLVAPNHVPDKVPEVASAPPSTDTTPVGDANATGPATGTPGTGTGPGVPWGDAHGVGNDGPPATAEGPKLYKISDGVKAPVAIRRVSPAYPAMAQKIRKSGFVILECIIDQSGHVRDARVVQSSFGAFDQPALDAVQQWQFQPGTLNGQPVDVVFDLKVTFEVR
jgi:protein TonB